MTAQIINWTNYKAIARRNPRRNKFNNSPLIVDQLRFASRKEAAKYQELKLLLMAGSISDLQMQVKFELIPKQGKLLPVSYIADFQYWDYAEEKLVILDVKGMKTDVYTIKKKLMLYIHGIEIIEC